MTSKHLPYSSALEKNVPVVYHNFTETIKMKHIFVAPREAGHWRLWDSFDARENVLPAVEHAKSQDYLVEIVVTDDDASIVAKMLHKRSSAFYRAGLGPDRTPPLPAPVPKQLAASGLDAPARRILKLKKRGRPRNKTPATPGAAVASPSQSPPTAQQQPAEQPALLQPQEQPQPQAVAPQEEVG